MASNPVKLWANGPYALLETPAKTQDISAHSALYIANEMANAHNCMIRGLNSICLQSPHVKSPSDIADLLFLTSSWAEWIGHHHRLEEETMFPGFEDVLGNPGILTANVEQHHVFAETLQTLIKYATTPVTEETYDAQEFRRILNALGPPLREHLEDEIVTLLQMREHCGDDPAKAQQLLSVYQASAVEAAKQDKFIVPPMVMGLADRTYEGGNEWPKIPGGVVSQFVIVNVLSLKHKRAWRFLPSDHWCQPRDLAFTGE